MNKGHDCAGLAKAAFHPHACAHRKIQIVLNSIQVLTIFYLKTKLNDQVRLTNSSILFYEFNMAKSRAL